MRRLVLPAFLLLSACGSVTENSHSNAYIVNKERAWDTQELTVCWDRSLDSNMESSLYDQRRLQVQAIIEQEYHAKTSIRFSGWKNCDSSGAHIRLTAAGNRPFTKGLGREIDHKKYGMLLNLSFSDYDEACNQSKESLDACLRYQAIHEFGHALGLAHEHNRPDTNSADCSFDSDGQMGDRIIGEWDRFSIMNYCASATEGTAVFDGLNPFPTQLSTGDIVGLYVLYNKSGIQATGQDPALELFPDCIGDSFGEAFACLPGSASLCRKQDADFERNAYPGHWCRITQELLTLP